MRIKVYGAGLAGCEAAAKLSSLGFEVDLFEVKDDVGYVFLNAGNGIEFVFNAGYFY